MSMITVPPWILCCAPTLLPPPCPRRTRGTVRQTAGRAKSRFTKVDPILDDLRGTHASKRSSKKFSRRNTEIGDRREAISTSIAELRRGDVLLIAGKGHETGQIVGKQVLPFSDHEAVAAALEARVG